MRVKVTSLPVLCAFVIAGLLSLASCVTVPNQVSGSAKAGDALDLPKPPQPEAQALLARFVEDHALVKKAGPAFFQPATLEKWPCNISQSTIYQAADLVMADPVEAEKIRLKIRKSLREQGLDPSLVAQTKYLNVHISPVSASCKNGKVDGDVELLAEYETLYENKTTMNSGGKVITMTTKNSTKEVSRVWTRFDLGKVAAPVKNIKQVLRKNETAYDDQAMSEMMAKNAIPQSKVPETVISYGGGLSPEFSANFTVKMTPKVSGGIAGTNIALVQELQSVFISPAVKNGTRTSDIYSNKEWSLTLHDKIKDGQKHGEQIVLTKNVMIGGKSMVEFTPGGRLVTFNGMEVIETRKCFISGQEVKTANCPKD